MITLDLLRICELKGIVYPHAFLKRNGFSHRISSALVSGAHKGIRFEHLEKLCRLFHCLPHELFNYKPTGRRTDPANDPLLPLRKGPEDTANLQSLVASMPPAEILRITNEIRQRNQKPPASTPQDPTDLQPPGTSAAPLDPQPDQP